MCGFLRFSVYRVEKSYVTYVLGKTRYVVVTSVFIIVAVNDVIYNSYRTEY